MSKEFKVGDKVRVARSLASSIKHCGHHEDMADMIDMVYTIDDINCRGNVILSGVYFHPDDLTHVVSFVEAMIAGEPIYNPAVGGWKNGKFEGYMVTFTDSNGKNHYTMVDSNGLTMGTFDLTSVYYHSDAVQLVIQEPKRRMHSVAYTLDDSHDWETENFSDMSLNSRKPVFHEYKILDTWFE